MTNNQGFNLLQQTVSRFRRTSFKKTSIEEMTFEEAIVAQQKYLKWIATHPDHEEAEVQSHIYTTYLLPRLEQLQFEENIKKGLNPPKTYIELQAEVLRH